MTAAQIAIKALKENRFDSQILTEYDLKIYSRLSGELKLSHNLQKLCRYPGLFNFVINKAEKNPTFRETISCMFEDLDLRAKFRSPAFYFRMIFGH